MKNTCSSAAALIAALLAVIMLVCGCSIIKTDRKDANCTELPSMADDGTGSPDTTDGADVTEDPNMTYLLETPQPTDEAGNIPQASETAGETETSSTAEPASSGSTPAPTQQNAQPTASNTETAEPTPKPDPVTQLTWFDDSAPVYCDLDFDGKSERIELKLSRASANTYNCTLSVVLGTSGTVLKDTFTAEYFTKALINNFNTGDNRVEIVVSTGTGNRGQVIRAYRLNAASTALMSTKLDGWIETVGANSIEVGRYIDLLGTWGCTADFAFAASGFTLTQQSEAWQVHRDSERWCTVSKELIVELLTNSQTENCAGFLYYGDLIYPVETDLASYITFVSDLDETGNIEITVAAGGALLINGTPVDDWFLDLTYID